MTRLFDELRQGPLVFSTESCDPARQNLPLFRQILAQGFRILVIRLRKNTTHPLAGHPRPAVRSPEFLVPLVTGTGILVKRFFLVIT